MDPLGRRRTIKMIKDWAKAGKTIIVSSHVLHEVELMTPNILLIHNGRILAEGNVHQIRELIDEHPHKIYVRAAHPRAVAREFLEFPHVSSLSFEENVVVVETTRPDDFYTRLAELAAREDVGAIDEVTSPDDNLQAVFKCGSSHECMHSLRQRQVGHAVIEVPDVVTCRPESVGPVDDELGFVVQAFDRAVIDGHAEVVKDVALVAAQHPGKVAQGRQA